MASSPQPGAGPASSPHAATEKTTTEQAKLAGIHARIGASKWPDHRAAPHAARCGDLSREPLEFNPRGGRLAWGGFLWHPLAHGWGFPVLGQRAKCSISRDF